MPPNLVDLLDKRWVHSHEEDTAAGQVFRPSNYKLPPSRGRFSFELKADGRMVQHGLGVTDRSLISEGTWKLEDDNLILSSQSAQAPDQILKIVSATPNRLIVEK